MIRLQNIQRTYATDEVETTALADINLHVTQGELSYENGTVSIEIMPTARVRPLSMIQRNRQSTLQA